MAKSRKNFLKQKRIKFFIIGVIVLLIILTGFFVCKYFIVDKVTAKNYIIKNKYYGFELKIPKNWSAEENTSYSEQDINTLTDKCSKEDADNASSYQIGAFRFKDQEYPNNFGTLGYFPENAPTGAIIEVAVNCVPDYMKNKVSGYGYSDLKIGGEKVAEEFLNMIGFGKTKYLSFFHNSIGYKISEHVYISPQDKNIDEASVRNGYDKVFEGIISSFKFK